MDYLNHSCTSQHFVKSLCLCSLHVNAFNGAHHEIQRLFGFPNPCGPLDFACGSVFPAENRMLAKICRTTGLGCNRKPSANDAQLRPSADILSWHPDLVMAHALHAFDLILFTA